MVDENNRGQLRLRPPPFCMKSSLGGRRQGAVEACNTGWFLPRLNW